MKNFISCWLILAVILLTAASDTEAQSVWTGGGGNSSWTNADNWGGSAPVAGNGTDLQFDGSTQLTANNNFANGSLFRSITFNSGAGAFTLTGNTLGTTGVAGNFNVTNNSSNVQTVNMNFAYSISGSAGLTLNSTIGGGILILGGNISGGSQNNNFSLNLNNTTGVSTIRLSGNNTGLSNTPISSANHVNVVEVGSNSTFSGIVRVRGAQLVAVGGNRTIARSVDIGGSGIGLSVAGEDSFTFSGGVGHASATGNAGVSIIFNTSGTTTFAGGISAPPVSSSSEKVTNLAGSGSVILSGNMVNGTGGIRNAFAWNNSQTLTISGNITSNGTSSLSGGQVILDYGTNNTSKLTEGVLTLGGSKVTMQGVSGNHVETVASTTLAQGATTITRASGATTLALGAMTRAVGNGGTLAVSEDGLATTTTANTNGILGGYVLVGNNWGYNSGNVITGLTAYQTDINDTSSTTQNLGLTGNGTLTASRTQNSLKILSSGAGESLDLGSGQSLSLTSGGLLFAGANNYSISNGTLSVGAASASNNDLKIFVTDAGNLTIDSVIANGNGTNGLTKSGSGKLVLTNSNTYNGSTMINQGTVSIAAGEALGTGGSLVINGGTLETTQTFALTKASGIALGVDGGIFQVATGTTLTLNNALINGAATYADTTLGSLVKTGQGTLVTSDASTYTGATVINQGVLSVSSLKDGAELYSGNYGAGGSAASGVGASTSSYRNLVLNGGTLRYTGGNTTSNRNFTIGTNGGTLDASGTGTLALTGTEIFLSGTNTARTFALTGNNTGANTLAGPLADNGSGATSLVKDGTGTWVLTGANSYTGGTQINGGTLIVNGLGSTGGGAVVVGANGAIGGDGTIGGDLSFASGADFVWNGIDTLVVNGASVTFSSFSGANLIVSDWSLVANGEYTLIGGSANVDMTNVATNYFDIGGGRQARFFEGSLKLEVIPEPSTWALLTASLTTVMILRRRRRR